MQMGGQNREGESKLNRELPRGSGTAQLSLHISLSSQTRDEVRPFLPCCTRAMGAELLTLEFSIHLGFLQAQHQDRWH